MTLLDTHPMPFGKHMGKPMVAVPADYLLFIWNDGLHDQAATENGGNPSRVAVRNYIVGAMTALRKECPDTIVKGVEQ